MNRLQYLVDNPAEYLAGAAGQVAAPPAECSCENAGAYCLFTPQHYEPNYAYPLIVWLHGPGGNERQVTQVMPLVSLRNYVAVGPRGTQATCAAGQYDWSQDAEAIARAEECVEQAVDAARRSLHIAAERIYLAGLGCGGTMALRLALARPELYAGVLSIEGALPNTLRPLARLHAARRLHVLLAAGRQSREYPEAEVCRNLRLLHAANIPLNLRLYPGNGELTTDMLADMDRWIMEQVAAVRPAARGEASHSSRRR